MAEVLLVPPRCSIPMQTQNISDNKSRLPPTLVTMPLSGSTIRNGHSNLDVFSPVNQNGSFEFDRVLKSGEVCKRTRKTKQWKRYHLVLRPNLLSMYKSPSEEKLHKQISLCDLTAVAYLKDPKGRRQNIFGLFSPARNFHFQAKDQKDARDWVELIGHEARIDEQEEEMTYGSPVTQDKYQSLMRTIPSSEDHDSWDCERLGSSSPEPPEMSRPATERDGILIQSVAKPSHHEFDYSGNDHGSYSDFSDTTPQAHIYSQLSALPSNPTPRTISNMATDVPSVTQSNHQRRECARNFSDLSVLHPEKDVERVIWHGYLLYLKSKGAVRQWKKLWVVLRSRNLAFYKNEEEYAARLIIPLSSIISAVEIDPVSKSKSHCMQIIAEERSFRFCAQGEEALARWLGALKSQLARRKENSSNRKATLA